MANNRRCGNCVHWLSLYQRDHHVLGRVVQENWCTRICGHRDPADEICGDPRIGKANTAFVSVSADKGVVPGLSFLTCSLGEHLMSEAFDGWEGATSPAIATPVEEEDCWDDEPVMDCLGF